jgi:hypothetical protein
MFRLVQRAAATASLLLASSVFAAEAPSLRVEPYAFRLADGSNPAPPSEVLSSAGGSTVRLEAEIGFVRPARPAP